MTTSLQPADPRRLGRYEILARIGAGGMGAVFLGRDPAGRLVAVKVIRPEYAGEDEFRGRFRSEVNRARQVPPFCTAEVLDADPEHVTPYLVVEYVDGPDLAEVVRENGPLTGGALHSVAVGVATALVAIHGAGVVHRDLKPRNVLFALGSPKVIDFGIAQAMEATSRHTRTDQMVGTLAYMAPERFDVDSAQPAGPAADVFAWGAVVTYAGTGHTPFAGDTPTVTAARILTQPPDLDGLPPALRDLVLLTLAKDPARRPTAHELLDLLLKTRPGDTRDEASRLAPGLRRAAEAAQHTGFSPAGRAPGGPSPVGDRLRRHRQPHRRRSKLLVGAVTAVVLAALTGAGLAVLRPGPSGPPAPAASGPVTVVRGPTVLDALDREGQWTTDIGTDDGLTCTFADGRMTVATRPGVGSPCSGPVVVFARHQSVAVDVTLGSASSCALIWLRAVISNGYRVTLCPGRAEVGIDVDGAVTPVTSTAPASLTAGRRQRITIEVLAGQATVRAGTTPILSAALSEPALVAGEVRLGATGKDLDQAAKVSFARAEFRSLPLQPSTAFPDLSAATISATAKLEKLADFHHSITLESVILVPEGDSRSVTGSQTHVTLPLSARAKFFSPLYDADRPQDCFDDSHQATCPRQEEVFEGWISRQKQPAVVLVDIRAGVVVRVAAIDLG